MPRCFSAGDLTTRREKYVNTNLKTSTILLRNLDVGFVGSDINPMTSYGEQINWRYGMGHNSALQGIKDALQGIKELF